MEEILKQILKEIQSLKDGQKQLFDGQQQVTKRLDSLENKVDNMKAQQDENTGLIQAILHNVEVANAEINGLKLSTASKEVIANLATKEDIVRLDAKLDVLTIRQTNQEADIRLLRKA